jgi:putative transposase
MEGCHETDAVTEEQIAFALRQAESGTSVDLPQDERVGTDVYRWKKQFVGMGVTEIRRRAGA